MYTYIYSKKQIYIYIYYIYIYIYIIYTYIYINIKYIYIYTRKKNMIILSNILLASIDRPHRRYVLCIHTTRSLTLGHPNTLGHAHVAMLHGGTGGA